MILCHWLRGKRCNHNARFYHGTKKTIQVDKGGPMTTDYETTPEYKAWVEENRRHLEAKRADVDSRRAPETLGVLDTGHAQGRIPRIPRS